MSIKLIVVLVVLMSVNQVIGTGYGWLHDGFNRSLFWTGVKKIIFLFIGYGALAFASHYAAEYVPSAEYISGILIEPIARYFTKICTSLRKLLDDSASEVLKKKISEGHTDTLESESK